MHLNVFTFIFVHFVLYMFRYVIECPNCGVIYRSRQYWYGNQDPVDTVVRTEIQHVWPGVRRPSCFHLCNQHRLYFLNYHNHNHTDLELCIWITIYLLT